MRYLLDVNVLIALLDDYHIDHARTTRWFVEVGRRAWATCPIVQNGAVRIVGGANYTTVPFSCADVSDTIRQWCDVPEHEFWPDEISLLDESRIDRTRLTSPKRITDSYLLALAVHRRGQLATLDRRLSPDAVKGGKGALELIA